jgi:hypothetical protein
MVETGGYVVLQWLQLLKHGFGPLYLTCGESGEESRTHGINFADVASASVSKELPALGSISAENAMPLKASAFLEENGSCNWR